MANSLLKAFKSKSPTGREAHAQAPKQEEQQALRVGFRLSLGPTPAQHIYFLSSPRSPESHGHLHKCFNGLGLDENGNGVKLCLLQSLYSVARNI